MLEESVAVVCLIWYTAVILVSAIGVYQIRRNYVSRPAVLRTNPSWPHVTVIRPVKGLEPCLFECLASTFTQDYPGERLTIYLCVPTRSDPAYPTLERLLAAFPNVDARIFIEEEDPNLKIQDGQPSALGPNPKIRNMSRAYREAKGDIVWIIDCNVWVSPPTAGRMVSLLTGSSSPRGKKHKFVHQLPLAVDVSGPPQTTTTTFSSPAISIWNQAGGKLEETFLSSAHAKFYTAINTVAIAPCIVGKSNMFRRSHLNALTDPASPLPVRSTASVPDAQQHMPGIDYFSANICEDHLIGDLLWKNPVPDSVLQASHSEYVTGSVSSRSGSSSGGCPREERWGNHALLPPHPSNLAIQPVSHTSLGSYISRRVRWLRVRKFTVTAATLVEPGTESMLCSLYGAYAFTTLPFLHHSSGLGTSWIAFWIFWALSIAIWAAVDSWVWGMLQQAAGGQDEDGGGSNVGGSADAGGLESGECFPRGRHQSRRPLGEWVLYWLGRELLAFPIWAWAFFGGVSVVWRGRRFRVGTDMRVREISSQGVRIKDA